MKILHINSHYERVGGTEAYLLNLLDGLDESGVKNVMVYQYGKKITDERPSYQIEELTDFSLRPTPRACAQLEKILEKERPDAVHLHNVGNVEAIKICRGLIPTIRSVHTHSVYCPGGAKYLPAVHSVCLKKFGPLCIPCGILTHCISRRPSVLLHSYVRSHKILAEDKRLSVLLVGSQYVRHCMIQNGFSEERVKVLPHFTDLPPMTELPGKRNRILFSGRIVREKGLDYLLAALSLVRASWRLVVAGEGPDLGRAKKTAQKLGLSQQTEFVGWVNQELSMQLYRDAFLVVVPSLWPDPWGLVGIEAMSYCKPVIAFDVGGIPEWLDHGETGFLIKPYDIKEMAEKINCLLENPDRARDMGKKGRKKMENEFGKDKCIPALIKIYEDVIEASKN